MACGSATCSSFVLNAPDLPHSTHDMFACYGFVCAGWALFGVSEQELILGAILHPEISSCVRQIPDKYSSALLWYSPINTRNV